MFNTNTDKILSVFTSTIKKLETHIDAQVTKEAVARVTEEAARQVRAEYAAEREKAAKALAKLKAFFE